MLQQDSILSAQTIEGETPQSQARHIHSEPTVQQVLGWLPKNATPEQQDSAIQANIKPSEIHWSECPDTLHLPGHTKGKSFRDVSLPKYYKESFFSSSKFFHPEMPGGRMGVAGDPVPYSIAGDDLITSLLLGFILMAMVAISQSRSFIMRQIKNFFYQPQGATTVVGETANELRFQLFLCLHTSLMSALIYFLYARRQNGDTFVVDYYQVISIYTGLFAAYFLLKFFLYTMCNYVFFPRKDVAKWSKFYVFIISVEGVALFPIAMLQAYFDMMLDKGVVLSAIVVILIKILTILKSYIIFFKRNHHFLQIILYFCALEITPLLVLWSVLTIINSYLKINF